jgi:pyruvate formate lyase activating enzyme
MLTGKIHSIETMGLVDGPGIRTVIFMQGCLLRCAYCHNPDTWNCCAGKEYTVNELFNLVNRYKSFFTTSGGGVTLSGGDPLLQKDFVIEFLKLCKENNIHTALDTSGFGTGSYDEILKYTDLVLLDIKHIDEKEHIELTGRGRQGFLEFLEAVKANNKSLWIRHVVVPGFTDSREHISKLADYINTIPNVEKVELLPYHTFGVNKYKELNIPYKLEGTPPLSTAKLDELNDILKHKLLHGRRSKNNKKTDSSLVRDMS